MSVQDLITKYSQWNSSNIKYGAVKTDARGGKNIPILDDSKNKLTIQCPLSFSWGTNKNVDEGSGRISYNIPLQYPSEGYGTKSTNLFFEKMKKFEEKFIEDAVKHSKEWFNKKMTREVVEALFCPILKYPYVKGTKDPDYSRSPTTNLKVPFYDGKFGITIHDITGELIFGSKSELGDRQFENFIPKTSHIAPIIQCKGVWFIGGRFGVSFQVIQTMVRQPIRLQGQDKCYVKLDEEDLEELNTLDKKDETNVEKQGLDDDEEDEVDDVAVDDSDADDNVQDEVKQELDAHVKDEEEAEPEKPKRKRVKKKVVATKTS